MSRAQEKALEYCCIKCKNRPNCGLFFRRFDETSGSVNGRLATELPSNYVPATKEQRDLLFQKMHEAGYEWDAEKKELKKIDPCHTCDHPTMSCNDFPCDLKKSIQEPTEWNIFDFRTWQYIVSDVLTKKDGIGQYLDSGECKRIAKYMQEEWSKKLRVEQKPADNEMKELLQTEYEKGRADAIAEIGWSEEDEKMISSFLHKLEVCTLLTNKEYMWVYKKLKSLTHQATWKPSDEQIEALKDVLNDAILQYDFKGSLIKEEVTRKHAETIESLYNDLKKLREE